jgi:arylformamidase
VWLGGGSEERVDWLDISVPISEHTPVFTGDPLYHRELAQDLTHGGICNLSRLDMGAHTGTHIDAPRHFIAGAPTTETIPLDACIGDAFVVDATSLTSTIRASDLDRLTIPEGETRLLFKTRNSDLWSRDGFSSDFLAFGADAAQWLVDRGVRLVAIDYLSIAPFGDAVDTHRVFLGAGVVVVEGTDLRQVTPGPYELLCLPLRLVGSDGAPARALLRPRSAHR